MKNIEQSLENLSWRGRWKFKLLSKTQIKFLMLLWKSIPLTTVDINVLRAFPLLAWKEPGSTTENHIDGYIPGTTETYPMVELKITIEQNLVTLEKVMDAIHNVHHYEEPIIFLRENWVSRANYNPDNDNPNRFWNNGRGLPGRIDRIS